MSDSIHGCLLSEVSIVNVIAPVSVSPSPEKGHGKVSKKKVL